MHTAGPAHALPRGFGLDRLATPVRFCHLSSHRRHLRHQPWRGTATSFRPTLVFESSASGPRRCRRLLWGHPRLRGARQRQVLCARALRDTYVQDTVTVLSSDSGTPALGSAFRSREHINVRACDEMRSSIVSLDHAPTEKVLTMQCADVSRLMYHMRINGATCSTMT